MNSNKKTEFQVGVYWKDIRVYHDNDFHIPSQSYTEGLLIEHLKDKHILIKNPTTILITDDKVKNHSPAESEILYIPYTLIDDIVDYENREK